MARLKARHGAVAALPVKNRPETGTLGRRSFRAAAGWSAAPTLPLGFVWPKLSLGSFGQNAQPTLRPHAEEHRSAKGHACSADWLRCDASRSMRARAVARPHPSRRRCAPPQDEAFETQDEDDHRLRHSSPCQTAHLVPAPALLRPGFASLASPAFAEASAGK